MGVSDLRPELSGEERRILFRQETFNIVGCAIEVSKTLGCGLLEKPYENAMCIEMHLRHIPFKQQESFHVTYKGRKVGEFIPDLLVYDSVIVDVKTVETISDHERGQILNYLRVTGLRLGLIMNFKHQKMQWERIVL